MLKIIFKQESAPDTPVEIEANPGETIAQVATRANVVIQQTCGGTPSCTDCRVKILENWQNALMPAEHAETQLCGNVYFITKERLACQAVIKESCSIYVPSPKLPNSASSKRPKQRSNQNGKEKEKSYQEKSRKKNG